MTPTESKHPKVFISYSHDSPEHKDHVLNLSNRLRIDGIDCYIDQYEESPREGWPQWTRKQIKEADFVLIVCTEKYERRFEGEEEIGKGLGAKWEGAIITQGLYEAEANNIKFIPVLFSSQDLAHIPVVLRSVTYYKLDTEETEEGYENLYRRLTNQPRILKPEFGKLRPMPPLKFKETRVQQAGGTPHEETVLEIAHQIRVQEDRKRFLDSTEGVQAANVELAKLLDELERCCDKISANNEELTFGKERNDIKLVLSTRGLSLSVFWGLRYTNTLKYSRLFIILLDNSLFRKGEIRFRQPQLLKKFEFDFDRDAAGELGWRQSNGEKQLFTSAQLAQECMKILLDEVRNIRLSG
ncbi:MAG: SEFIR domain-containing protein [Ignavibacteriales bacterium]